MSVDFCGGSCIEDVTTHLMCHLSLHPTLRTCSADTILRAINCFGTRNTRNVQKLMRHLMRELMGINGETFLAGSSIGEGEMISESAEMDFLKHCARSFEVMSPQRHETVTASSWHRHGIVRIL